MDGKGPWATVGFVARSPDRLRVLLALVQRKTPAEIARETGLPLSVVSRALRGLSDRGLVECMNPRERTGRLYVRTAAGNRLIRAVESLG